MTKICANCIDEPKLREKVSIAAIDHAGVECQFCERAGPTVDIDFVAGQVETVIEYFYDYQAQSHWELESGLDPDGFTYDDILCSLKVGNDDVVEEIASVLAERWQDWNSDGSLGGDPPVFSWRNNYPSSIRDERWDEVEKSLRLEARFVNPKVTLFMQDLFEGVSEYVSNIGDSVIVDAGPGTEYEVLYRARVFENIPMLGEVLGHPERLLGTPAPNVSRGGRMNAVGQPAFYGAIDIQTAIAEVRPPVGSHVVTAKFKITRPLKLLDLERLQTIEFPKGCSLFHENARDTTDRIGFIRKLCKKMQLPVMPEQQDHNYLITQVFASYLSTLSGPGIDGVIYPSIQRGGEPKSGEQLNVVLFYKSALVMNADAEIGNTACPTLYERDEGIMVFDPSISFRPLEDLRPLYHSPDSLNAAVSPTLLLDQASINIHLVKSVYVTLTTTKVMSY